jgi:uncharacterized membrane protein YczE
MARLEKTARRQVVPRLRGGSSVRASALLTGLFMFASGIVALLESRLGLSSWDVFHQGLADHTGLSFGAASIAVSIVVLALVWSLGARLGVGTVANAILVGAFVEALTSIAFVDHLASASAAARVLLLVCGLALMGVGTALYLSADLGAGPRDSLMVVGAQRLGVRVGLVRGALEVLVLGAGAALGGTVGVGTVAFALGIGPAVEGGFSLLERSRLALPRGGEGGEGAGRPPACDPVARPALETG